MTNYLLKANITLNNFDAVGFYSILNLIINGLESIVLDSRISDKSINGDTSFIPNLFSIKSLIFGSYKIFDFYSENMADTKNYANFIASSSKRNIFTKISKSGFVVIKLKNP